ncbi:hypothetical protein NEA10_13890 [Phormidium yuhuli AB48]|uniref:Peptidase S24/S26A/S26B/S26C domain-containing protein n=1 Tax=Phormidium yuhuli AB48 TaxID=2940671 RepID=A0ABY5AL64_9CYAN|nr:S24 family peptidase [Phormidium yuhuli]USR89940.1 hypothetical protein NEA10_13890 [Phormidium yuhuli AB48]
MGRGGRRVGAGRPPGTGKYGEPTKAVRLPVRLAEHLSEVLATWGRSPLEDIVPHLQRLRRESEGAAGLPLYSRALAAGELADEEMGPELDLNGYLAPHRDSSFCVQARGESMRVAGIQEQDLLVVDTLPDPQDGDLVMAVVEGELLVRRLQSQGDRLCLLSDNSQEAPLVLSSEREFYLLGVVTHAIHAF